MDVLKNALKRVYPFPVNIFFFLFQDAAGTTHALVDDPVGLVKDRTSNGNDASQSTDSARPFLRDDGTVIAADFDGVDDRLIVGNIPSSTVYTVEFWATFDNSSWRGAICGFGTSSSDVHTLYFFGNENDKFGLNTWGGDLYGVDGLSVLKDGNFHHIAAIIFDNDFQSFELYVDGSQLTTSQVRNTTVNRALDNNLGIGYNSFDASSQIYFGKTSEFRVWNVARTQTEIQNNKDERLNGDETNLIGYWVMGDKT